MFYFEDFHGTKILKSDLLEEITAFFSTRELPDLTKLGTGRILSPNQTHSDNVEFVDERNEYPNTDGLILQNTNDAVYLRFADCTPLIFYDTVQKIAAVSHAGWRGTASQIGKVTVELMVKSFGCRPEDIIAAIGPCIGPCCYEVDDPVKKAFEGTAADAPGVFSPSSNPGHYMLDLRLANRAVLIDSGILPENIDVADICTCCNSSEMHSHRATAGKRGNLAAIIELI